jgi:PAS domain S-box-containing protein
MDAKGIVIAANTTMAERFGRTTQEVIGESIYDLMPASLVGSRRSHIEKVVRTGRSVHFSDRRAGMDLDNFVHPIPDANSKVTKLAVFSMDVTERRQAEESIKRVKEEWEMTFNAVPDLIAIIDKDHRIVRVNQAMADRVGLHPDEAKGLFLLRNRSQ